ncbi:MAG TPA: palindromic element RPE3 domain-containing protein [Rickettsia endosymbiont of Omalisus fontisbellaquei]|nr:palindromic element RPE3 domain-containing protein [Rickettsia endosymbiont of Omalisus fontisbellaquei]
MQLDSESFRQDELTTEPAERTKVREQRRVSENSLVSGFLNDAVKNITSLLLSFRTFNKPTLPTSESIITIFLF